MKKLTVLFVLFFSLSMHLAFAQVEITGTISGEDGNPLPGVSILIKGTQTGVITDADGMYSITAGKGDVLEFSFIGMLTEEVTVADQTIINLVLVPDVTSLEEVMVVAYGTTKKASFTGSAAVVDYEELSNQPVTSFEKALEGRVAGLQISNSTGQPGAETTIRIRGIGSFSASSSPLYVIDGIPVVSENMGSDNFETNIMATIAPGDIESVTVLKDAAAASLYGSRAANGVIIITTKKGQAGKTKYNFKTTFGSSYFATKNFETVNGEEFIELQVEAMENDGWTQEEIDAKIEEHGWTSEGGYTDWEDLLFSRANSQKYELSASGGDEKTTYYASGSYFDQDGVADNSELQRISGRLNLTHKVNKKLDFGVNINVSQTNQDVVIGSGYWSNPFYFLVRKSWPTESPYDSLGNLKKELHGDGYNFLRENELNERSSVMFRANTTGWLNWNIVEGLNLKTSFSHDWINNDERFYASPASKSGDENKGEIEQINRKNIRVTSSTVLSYEKVLGNVHHINVIGGYEVEKDERLMYGANGNNLPNETLMSLSVAAVPASVQGYNVGSNMISYFSRFNYDLLDKYYASFSYRRDGSSRFGKDSRWGDFYSVSGSWRISEEAFLSSAEFLNTLKLRVSYGTNGTLPGSMYASQSLYGYSGSYNGNPAAGESQIGNEKLTWEKNKNLSTALEFRVIDRISGTIEYFNRRSSDLLMQVPLAVSVGFDEIWENIGEMENKGFEFELTTANIVTNEFQWMTDFNISAIKNKIVKLSSSEPLKSSAYIKEEGSPYYTFYLRPWAGVDPENGDPLWYMVDEEGNQLTETTNDYRESGQVNAGSPDPDFFGGINNRFSYKGFHFSFLFNFSYGGTILYNNYKSWGDGYASERYSIQREQLDRWQKPGDVTKFPKRVWDGNNRSYVQSTRLLYDNNYLRLKNVNLSYDIPKQIIERINVDKLTVYVQGANLLTFASQDLCDPEQYYNGYTSYEIPNLKTVTFGLDISF